MSKKEFLFTFEEAIRSFRKFLEKMSSYVGIEKVSDGKRDFAKKMFFTKKQIIEKKAFVGSDFRDNEVFL